MTATADQITQRTRAMRDEMAPMTLHQALGYGRSRYFGGAFDGLIHGLMTDPLGESGGDAFMAWLEGLREYAEAIRSKAR